MFILLRRIERWLHQHVFKVGWLVTKNYQTTTILYYTFFLPGVFLHELVYWLVAGMLGVHGLRSLKWPEQQEVAELKLNFVHISNRTGVYRKAIITIAPMLIGLIFIWFVANNVFDIMTAINTMSSGQLVDVAKGIGQLIGTESRNPNPAIIDKTPLFWMWSYIIFTIANTMYPTVTKDLQGWRIILLAVVALIAGIALVGAGGTLFATLQTPLSNLIFVLQATFALIIGIDVLMVLILGTIEYMIERITGNSATFHGNKMITMTRQEALDERQKARERERRQAERRRNTAATTGPNSVYLLVFSIPGAPGEEPITKLVEQEEVPLPEKDKAAPESLPLFGGLAERAGADSRDEGTQETKERREAIASRIQASKARPPVPAPPKPASSDEKADQAAVKPAEKASIETHDEQKDTIESPAATRFGSRPARPQADKTDTDEQAPKSPAAAHFGKPLVRPKSDQADTDEQAPKSPAASRFGKPFARPKADDDNKEEQVPKSPAASRFGSPVSQTQADETDEEEAEVRPDVVVGRPATASRLTQIDNQAKDDDEDDDTKTIVTRPAGFAPRATRFGPGKPSDTDDKGDEEHRTGRFSVSPFSRSADAEEDESPAAGTGGSRSGIRKPPATTASNRFGVRRPSSDDNEDDEELDASAARQSRGQDAVSSLFGRLETEADDEDDDGLTSSTSRFRRPAMGASTGRFGTSRPAPKPVSDISEEDDEEGEDEELIYEDIEDEYADDEDEYFDDYEDD